MVLLENFIKNQVIEAKKEEISPQFSDKKDIPVHVPVPTHQKAI